MNSLATHRAAPDSATAAKPAVQVPEDASAYGFPLPLTPFERYMVVDDRPGYPMTYAAALEFQGTVSREALEQAVAQLSTRHPMLSARLEGSGRSSVWRYVEKGVPKVEWCDTPPAASPFHHKKIDLSNDAPLRIEAYTQDDRTRIVFSFHHAMCDGIGCSQIIGDVLAFYGMATAAPSEQPRLLKTQTDLLPQRGQLQITLPAPISRWQALRGFWTETWKVISRRPALLQRTKLAGGSHTNEGILVTTVEQIGINEFTERAASQNVTANDLFIRDLFLTMKRWREKAGHGNLRHWLRMTIPTSLRSRRDLRMPATNILGYALLTHREGDCDRSDGFLQGLASDMRAVQKWGLGAMFWHAIQLVDRMPGGLYLGTRLGGSFSTIVLSGLGDPTRRFRANFPRDEAGRLVAGNLALESMTMAPPVRPGTHLAIGIINYRGVINCAAQYDATRLSAAKTREFLEMYADQISKSFHEGEN